MDIHGKIPPPRILSIIFGIAAVICFILMIALLMFAHKAVSTDPGTIIPSQTDSMVGAAGILGSLSAFAFGLVGVICVVICVVCFLQSRKP
jgi:preprotein translocase subunit SecG